MDTSTVQLADEVRAGDTTALADYIQRRRRELLGFVQRRMSAALLRKLEPEDVLQELSVYAVRGLASIDLSRHDLYTWLCRLAERRIIDAHRHHFRAGKRDASREIPLAARVSDASQAALLQLLTSSGTSPSAVLSRDQKQLRLIKALSQLPIEQRRVIRMRFAQGMATKQIACELQKSDGAIRVMVTRSLRRLKELLGPDSAPRN